MHRDPGISNCITEDALPQGSRKYSLSSITWQRRSPEAGRLLGWVVQRFSDLSKVPVHTLRSIVLGSTQGWFPPSCRVVVISSQGHIFFCSHPVEKRGWLPVIFLLKTKISVFPQNSHKFLLWSHWVKMVQACPSLNQSLAGEVTLTHMGWAWDGLWGLNCAVSIHTVKAELGIQGQELLGNVNIWSLGSTVRVTRA